MNKEEAKYATLEKPKTPQERWAEHVDKSSGTMFFLPEQFQDEAKEIEKYRKEFNDFMQKVVSEKEIDLSVKTQNFFYKLRKHLKESGNGSAFYKDIGWNQDAVDEGIFVINLFDPAQRR